MDKLSITIGGALFVQGVVSDWITFIDQHAWVAGFVVGMLTVLINLIFKLLNFILNTIALIKMVKARKFLND